MPDNGNGAADEDVPPPGAAGGALVRIHQFIAEALGDASYLLVSGNEAAAVDPQRDVRPLLAAAEAAGAVIRFVFETHVHNDYLSGGRELAARGATVVAPAAAGLAFPHEGVEDGEEVAVGGARLRAMATPGHTYEHTAYLAVDERGQVAGAFTGGSVLMAAAGRSDLLGPEHTDDLLRLQWESARRLAGLLPPAAEILPTHGAGSFCSATTACADRRAPLSAELARNPIFLTPSSAAFRSLQPASAAPIPGYYRHMAPINRAGARVFGEPPVPSRLDPAGLEGLIAAGTRILDVRPRLGHAAAHVPGSLGIEESDSLLAYTGWLVPFNAALALVAPDAAQAERVTVALFRLGYEDVRGSLPFAAWQD
ncbi:MAG: MBL fold metallo-hydrolase, partial [Dehalococcoidia bacterium]|nr:MBL fold metallo-hydrolase [Dehalococcoidia bacterium]